jgi:NTE family protein
MGAEVVVAVDISSAPDGNPSGDPLQILLQTFAIMGKSINSWELKDADVVVRPSLRGMGSGDFTGRRRAIDAGRAAMQSALPQLRAAMDAKAQ